MSDQAPVNQVRLLARTFFVRLFESDLMPPGLPQVQLIIWSVVLVATPALSLPGVYAYKYAGLWFEPGTLGPAIATDRLVLLTFAMIAAGLVAIATWENALPDRRDARILGVLPITTASFIAARLLALGCLFLLFFATLGVLPSLFFAGLAAAYWEPGGFFWMVLAQVIAALAGATTAFCAVIALQCLVVNLFGRSAAQRAAIAIQVLFAIALLQMIFYLPAIGASMKDGMLQPDWLSSPSAARLPSVWFLALYDVLIGYGSRNSAPLATLAVVVTLTSFVAAVALYGLGYRRMLTHALEVPVPGITLWRRLRAISGWRRALRTGSGAGAVRAAVREFTVRTLLRSRQHRTLLAIYAGLGLAVVVSSLLPLVFRPRGGAFAKPNIAVLAAPLVMQFMSLVAMRIAFAIPVDIKANWVVRLREPRDLAAAMDGVLAAMFTWGVLPFVLLAGLSAGTLWGAAVAARHMLVSALLGWLLAELLLTRFCKVPFTCTYFPGRSQVNTLWPVYFTAFTFYSYSMASLELQMLRWPRVLAWFIIVVGGGALVARTLRRRWLRSEPLRFTEEDPDAMFEGFHLSEGLAAASPRSSPAP